MILIKVRVRVVYTLSVPVRGGRRPRAPGRRRADVGRICL